MRWLTVANYLDIFGADYTGSYWALTNIPAKRNDDNAHLPSPHPSQACFALQVLDVVEMQLPEDIDTAENETGEKEMKEAGYIGNANCRAIPLIIVRYASLPELGSTKVGHKCLNKGFLLTRA